MFDRKSTSRLLLGSMITLATLSACSPQKFAEIEQGPGPDKFITEKATESFIQDADANKVDILIVNDNSPSMYEEQTKLSQRFSSFISEISDMDYHIGMTTTDVDSSSFGLDGDLLVWEGTGSTVLKRSTANADAAFKKTIPRSETLNCNFNTGVGCASSNEQPLLAVIRSILKRFTSNSEFYRERSPLVVVVLSDEDEMSSGPIASTTSQMVLNAINLAFGSQKRLMFTGIVIKPGDGVCRASQRTQSLGNGQGQYATRVAELASLTGANLISICENDYAQPLSEMSKQMRRLLTTFELQQVPNGEVVVKMTPDSHIGYRLEGKSIIFDAPPPAGTKIDITYGL